jgi:O-antigen ligase
LADFPENIQRPPIEVSNRYGAAGRKAAKTIPAAFAALVVLAPLPFGMAQSHFQAWFAFLVLLQAAGYCGARLAAGEGPAVGLEKIRLEALGFFLVIGWGVFQLVNFAPSQWHHPLWAEAGAVLGRDLDGSISLARGDGFEALMRLLAYGAVFFLALQLGRDRAWAGRLIWALVLAGTAYALYGLAMHFGGVEKVLWVEREGAARNVTGPFINRNHFATYLGLVLLCAAGLYLEGFLKALKPGRTGRDRLLHLLQQGFVRGAPLLGCVLILVTALFLTNSRAGVISALAALLVLVVFLGLMTTLAGRAHRALTLALLAGVLGVFFLSGEGWLARLTATDLEREARLQRYEQTWQAVQQSPWTGYGVGSYGRTFFIFADEGTVTSYKAHNDWLETAFELGLPAAVLWLALLGGLGVRCLAGFFRRRRDHAYPVAGFCACVLVGLHSLADFSLQIPAVAVTFAVLLGVGVAQGWSSVNR